MSSQGYGAGPGSNISGVNLADTRHAEAGPVSDSGTGLNSEHYDTVVVRALSAGDGVSAVQASAAGVLWADQQVRHLDAARRLLEAQRNSRREAAQLLDTLPEHRAAIHHDISLLAALAAEKPRLQQDMELAATATGVAGGTLAALDNHVWPCHPTSLLSCLHISPLPLPLKPMAIAPSRPHC